MPGLLLMQHLWSVWPEQQTKSNNACSSASSSVGSSAHLHSLLSGRRWGLLARLRRLDRAVGGRRQVLCSTKCNRWIRRQTLCC